LKYQLIMENKALVKTTKSPFDIQVDNATRLAKSSKGICFTLRRGNSIEYVNIPNVPQQTFKYFDNTSHLTNAERQAIYRKRNEIKLLTTKPILTEEIVETVEEYLP
jgi:hypothetical protein